MFGSKSITKSPSINGGGHWNRICGRCARPAIAANPTSLCNRRSMSKSTRRIRPSRAPQFRMGPLPIPHGSVRDLRFSGEAIPTGIANVAAITTGREAPSPEHTRQALPMEMASHGPQPLRRVANRSKVRSGGQDRYEVGSTPRNAIATVHVRPYARWEGLDPISGPAANVRRNGTVQIVNKDVLNNLVYPPRHGKTVHFLYTIATDVHIPPGGRW